MDTLHSGLDLDPVISWLNDNKKRVQTNLFWLHSKSGPLYKKIYGTSDLQLTAQEITEVLSQFPAGALERSVLERIRGTPTAWFKKGSTATNLEITHRVSDAILPSGIVPAHTGTILWDDKHRQQEIKLFKLPIELDIAKYMLVHGLFHEICHTLINPIWYNGKRAPYILDMPNIGTIAGKKFLIKFAELASKHSPISHYSAINHPIPCDPTDEKFFVAMSEEMCECISAYLLGYMYCDEKDRCWDPFMDRPQIKAMVKDFLEARKVG
ncbi:MAG: hypothetical protein M3Q80_02755 [bacterium]|nr:hypothetical protein [bacterium]